jgi:hypothetical protein
MHTRGAFKAGQTVFGITAILVFVLTVVPLSLGQTPTAGNNDVYNSSGPKPSSAFIDAQALFFDRLGSDLCDTIYGLLSGKAGFPTYPSTGAVIDARGISGTALTCTLGSPWLEGTTYGGWPTQAVLWLGWGCSKAYGELVSQDFEPAMN